MTDRYAAIRGDPVLVTGGLGFIGANLCRFLARTLGCRVTAVDDLSNTSPDAADGIDGLEVIVGDVRDAELMAPLVRTHPWIFHLACRTILTCAEDPEADLAVNALSTLRILELLRRAPRATGGQEAAPTGRGHTRDGQGRFVYASSTSIYGNCRHLPADELEPPEILNHYAATKLLGEHYTTLYHAAYGVPTVALRYSNVYGPGQSSRNPYCGVIGRFLDAARAGRPLTVHGTGDHTRDYTYVDDVVEATIRAALAPQALGEVFNVGTGVETSVNALAREISTLVGDGVCTEYVDRRDVDNIPRRALSAEKMRVRLGWHPRVSLREGLRRTIAASEHGLPLGDAAPRTAPRTAPWEPTPSAAAP